MKQFVLACLLLPQSSLWALDLTPHFSDGDNGLLGIKHPYFMDGSTRYAVTTDRETDVGSDDGAVFRFKTLEGATFRIRFSPLTPEVKFTDGLETYRKAVLQLAPSGSTDVAILHEDPDPLQINKWKSYRFVLAYKLSGSELRTEVTFLNISDNLQLLLATTAGARQFGTATSRGFNIIRSWHEMLPGEDNPARGN